MRYYFSLGSNLGDKWSNLQKAIAFLKRMGHLVSLSSIYLTTPVNMPDETEIFLNLVLSVDSCLHPQEMLEKIKRYEKRTGRMESPSGYQPRTIDIDIILVDDLIVEEKNLTIPHPKMRERAFVLVPLQEIAPELMHPVLKKTVFEILR
jgi:2-amino-4-hydroxy-6-hydroxymethyldihydropteridine diphosphokinase